MYINLQLSLHADDVKVYMEICNVEDAAKLQKALDLIAEWADEWQLGLSIGKCNTLSIGKHQDTTQYNIKGTELPCLPHCKDLGVVITSDLSPSLHIQQITTKAHQRANNILRCFMSGNVTLLVRACNVVGSTTFIVRPPPHTSSTGRLLPTTQHAYYISVQSV